MPRELSKSRRWPRGMTLVELLLVLALLAIAGSLTVPSIFSGFSSTRLRRAGDQILARWADARATAIESGSIQQFRFGVETGAYRIEPWSPLPAEDASRPTSGRSAERRAADDRSSAPVQGMALPSDAATLNDADVVQSQLNDGITFLEGQAATEDPLTRQVQKTSLAAGGGDWSTPILFFPDGTSSQATVVLTNDRENYVRLTLRALTGVGRSSNVLTRDDLQRGAPGR